MRSGLTPQWREPETSPVRPNPVMTSSAMSRMPWRSQISRTPGMKDGCGGMTPPAPMTGSMMNAATVAGTCISISASSAARQSAASRSGSSSPKGLR